MLKIGKHNFFIFLILIFFILFKKTEAYIVLPFKTNSPKYENNITKLFNELLDNKLIITLPLGTPPKNIDFYSKMNEYIYYLEEGGCKNIIDKDNTFSSSYNFKESKTFKERDKIYTYINLKQCYLGEDIIHLYQDINLKSTIEMPLVFYYGSNSENNNDNKICGLIGFQDGNVPYRLYDYENFVSVLKKNKITNSYSWYIHYFDEKNKINNFDGAIILDILNSKFFADFPFLKNEDDYNTISVVDLEHILAWTFNFDEIYYIVNETKIEKKLQVSGMAFETNFIHCPEAYFESIKSNFFNTFIKNNICFLIEENYFYIYCNKNGFEKHKKSFPSLYFKSAGLNRTYVLNDDDLFQDFGSFYFFMIIKPRYSTKVWRLGKIFMKKSNFYFDSSKKFIGYFDEVNPIEMIKENDKSESSFFDKIKWYIFIILGIILGFVIGKKIREKARKLRANELEDNYEYLENKMKGEKNNIKEKTNNDDNIEINKGQSNYSEIKSQLYDINEEKNAYK